MARRSSLVYPPTHLPLLHNPLLNLLFNHPNPGKSRLNKIMRLLSDHPEEWLVLVPVLVANADLCHDDTFVRHHVVREVAKNVYESLSGTTYTVSKTHLVLPDGVTQVPMLRNEMWYNFNSYMSDSCLYRLIYIAAPLSPEIPTAMTTLVDLEHADTAPETDFIQLIREFPLVSQKIGSIYRSFFTRLNLSNVDSVDRLVDSFNSIVNSGNAIFIDNLDKESGVAIVEKHPHVDMTRSLFEYIEMNIYEKLWARVCHLNTEKDRLLAKVYANLRFLALNQVEIPDLRHLDLLKLEQNVLEAARQLATLSILDSSAKQSSVLVSVFQLLAQSGTNLGADTLVALLIVVICRAQVPNLSSHVVYVERFSYEPGNGHMAYVLSTFGAVVDYLCEDRHVEALQLHSDANSRLWELLKDPVNGVAEVSDLCNRVNSYNEIPRESVLFARTSEGLSLLALLIRANNLPVFQLLLDLPNVVLLEDLLLDRNVHGATLLAQLLELGYHEFVDILVSEVLSSATTLEKVRYFNCPGSGNKTVGHLIFDLDLVRAIGPFLDWRSRDSNGQTPFFSMLRCYDHPQYDELVETAIEVVHTWYSTNNMRFDYRHHMDSKRNTVLHVIKSNLKALLRKFDNLNLNEVNSKSLTPLMYYIKYNRLENVRDILADARLDLFRLDNKFYLSALDYAKVDVKALIQNHHAKSQPVESNRNSDIEKMLDHHFVNTYFPVVNSRVFGLTRIKSDNVNKELCLFFKTHLDGQWYSNIHNYKDYLKLLRYLKRETPQLVLSTAFVQMARVSATQSWKINNFYKFQCQRLGTLINMSNILMLTNCSHSQILHDFLVKPGNLRDLNLDQDNGTSLLVSKPGQRLSLDEVTAMRHFFEYSLEQMTEFDKYYGSFVRMLVFVDIKSKEMNEVYSEFGKGEGLEPSGADFNTILPENGLRLIQDMQKFVQETSSCGDNFKFIAANKMLLFICQELLVTIASILSSKLSKWEECHKLLERTESEIHRLGGVGDEAQETVRPRRRSSNLLLTEPNVNERVVVDHDDEPSTSSTSFLFSSIVQTKKSRSLKLQRLQDKKSSVLETLRLLETDLKKDQELVALRLNNFLNFKRSFIRQQMKEYCESNIRNLKFGLELMRKV